MLRKHDGGTHGPGVVLCCPTSELVAITGCYLVIPSNQWRIDLIRLGERNTRIKQQLVSITADQRSILSV
jgi:hypothetical protein